MSDELPRTFRIQQDAARLVIKQRSSWPAVFAVMTVFGSLTSLIVWALLNPRSGRHIAIGVVYVLIVFLVVFWYGILMITLKSVTLVVTPTEIVSRTRSLPPRASVTLRVDELECIHIAEKRLVMAGTGSIYSLVAKRKDGGTIYLLTEADLATANALGRLIQKNVNRLEVRFGAPSRGCD